MLCYFVFCDVLLLVVLAYLLVFAKRLVRKPPLGRPLASCVDYLYKYQVKEYHSFHDVTLLCCLYYNLLFPVALHTSV